MGVCWFIFIGYILVDKNASISGIAIIWIPYFQNLPEEYCRILIPNMKLTNQDFEYAQNISKEGKFLLKKICWRLYSSKNWFSLQYVRTPRWHSLDASHREFYEDLNGLADANH